MSKKDAIQEFATKHGVSADEIRRFVAIADRDNPLWWNVTCYLRQRGVTATKEDLHALSDATLKALQQRDQPRVIVVSEPAPPAPAPEKEAATRADAVARLQAILTSPEAAGREPAARHLAFHSPLPTADAIAMLRTMPIGASTPAPAPRPHADEPPTEGLIRVYPPAARMERRDPQVEAGELWSRVAERISK